jgi:hypothetical protein
MTSCKISELEKSGKLVAMHPFAPLAVLTRLTGWILAYFSDISVTQYIDRIAGSCA